MKSTNREERNLKGRREGKPKLEKGDRTPECVIVVRRMSRRGLFHENGRFFFAKWSDIHEGGEAETNKRDELHAAERKHTHRDRDKLLLPLKIFPYGIKLSIQVINLCFLLQP